MRIQTWSLTIQLAPDRPISWSLLHSLYTKAGRQLPRQIAANEASTPEDLFPALNQLGDLIRQAYELETLAGAEPFPLGKETLRL
jgi:hypothetical protein